MGLRLTLCSYAGWGRGGDDTREASSMCPLIGRGLGQPGFAKPPNKEADPALLGVGDRHQRRFQKWVLPPLRPQNGPEPQHPSPQPRVAVDRPLLRDTNRKPDSVCRKDPLSELIKPPNRLPLKPDTPTLTHPSNENKVLLSIFHLLDPLSLLQSIFPTNYCLQNVARLGGTFTTRRIPP